MSRPGMKNGLTRRGPLSFSRSEVSAMPLSPPIPEPMSTPVRSCFSGVSAFHSASRRARSAAPMA